MPTNIPAPTFGPEGFVAPLESDILAGARADIQAAFGDQLNPSPKTPQGQLATSITALVGNTNDLFLYYTSQTDPAFAQGRMQDAIGRIYFLERDPARPTTVPCRCIGLPGVAIPAGVATAVALDGKRYVCLESGTIPDTGSITLSFACVTPGPIACPAGTLNQIYTTIPGWDSINNLQDGVPGRFVESRTDFEARRRLSVAHNSLGSLPSVLGAVLSVTDVLDAFAVQNDRNAMQVIGGYPVAANSIYVSVAGGDAQAIGQAIFAHKMPGCATNGHTRVIVEDTNSGYAPPYPSYEVYFDYAEPLPILFNVVIDASDQVPADAVTQVQNAIIAAFAGLDGGPRVRIGTEVLASRFYAPIKALGSWARILSLQIGCANAPVAIVMGAINGTTMQVTGVSSGTLAIGQTISDDSGAVLPGTLIEAFQSGTGGTGTYTLSKTNQAVSSRTLYASLPNQLRVRANINQVPTISASDIVVTTA